MKPKQPRVMFVLPSLISSGGAEQLVYRMIQNMISRKLSPIVCCLDSLGDLGFKLQEDGVKVYCRQQTRSFDLKLTAWMRGIIKDENIQIVHAHMYAAFEYSVLATLMSRKVKVVYTVHGRLYPEKRMWKRRLIYPLLSLGVDQFVSISEKTKFAMAYYDFHPEKKIRVIHNGIEIKDQGSREDIQRARIALGVEGNTRILGTAARLEDIKNIPMMIRALKRVMEDYPDTYLLIAGVGSKLDELKAYAVSQAISENVLFIGLRSDLHVIYPLFEVFLLSSYTEGVSVSLLEAMTFGVPAVVTDVGGNSEVVIEGETGHLVPSENDVLMAEKILQLFNNTELSRKLGKKGKERALTEFSFDGMMDEYMSLYHSLLN